MPGRHIALALIALGMAGLSGAPAEAQNRRGSVAFLEWAPCTVYRSSQAVGDVLTRVDARIENNVFRVRIGSDVVAPLRRFFGQRGGLRLKDVALDGWKSAQPVQGGYRWPYETKFAYVEFDYQGTTKVCTFRFNEATGGEWTDLNGRTHQVGGRRARSTPPPSRPSQPTRRPDGGGSSGGNPASGGQGAGDDPMRVFVGQCRRSSFNTVQVARRVCGQRQDPICAVQACRGLIRRGVTDNGVPYSLLGRALGDLGRSRAAIRAVSEAVRFNPRYLPQRGYLYGRAGRRRLALADYEAHLRWLQGFRPSPERDADIRRTQQAIARLRGY